MRHIILFQRDINAQETYYNQIELERVIHGSEFEQEKCDVCGENVDDS